MRRLAPAFRGRVRTDRFPRLGVYSDSNPDNVRGLLLPVSDVQSSDDISPSHKGAAGAIKPLRAVWVPAAIKQ